MKSVPSREAFAAPVRRALHVAAALVAGASAAGAQIPAELLRGWTATRLDLEVTPLPEEGRVGLEIKATRMRATSPSTKASLTCCCDAARRSAGPPTTRQLSSPKRSSSFEICSMRLLTWLRPRLPKISWLGNFQLRASSARAASSEPRSSSPQARSSRPAL